MKKKIFRYFMICTVSYLCLAVIEIFLLRPLVDMIAMNFWGRLGIYCVLLLIVDPFATRFIADHLDLRDEIKEDEDA